MKSAFPSLNIHDLEIDFPAFQIFDFFSLQMQDTPIKGRRNRKISKTAEIAQKICGKFNFKIRKSTIIFHIKIRKPHF